MLCTSSGICRSRGVEIVRNPVKYPRERNYPGHTPRTHTDPLLTLTNTEQAQWLPNRLQGYVLFSLSGRQADSLGVSQMALKRIHKELADIKKEDLGGITIESTDNLFLWNASIPGQEGSPYEGGIFRLAIHLPHDYPCVATLFHRACTPNISLCLLDFPLPRYSS